MPVFKKDTAAMTPDFPFEADREKKKNNGEDSFFWSVKPGLLIASVFDGCGGAGAKKYPLLSEKTGAYVASRVVSGAVRDWFEAAEPAGDTEKTVRDCYGFIKSGLEICAQYAGQTGTRSGIKNTMAREFPTTAAINLCRVESGSLLVLCVWAGDSRCYVLSPSGLCQLTEDDLSVTDSMENLSADAVLTNVICQNRSFELNSKPLRFSEPCLVFAATDGCFGYVPSPMHFEYLLLSAVSEAKSAAEWEALVQTRLAEITGDDMCLCGFSFGFGSFEKLKKAFAPRLEQLYSTYIRDFDQKTKEEKNELWREYKKDYAVYLKGE